MEVNKQNMTKALAMEILELPVNYTENDLKKSYYRLINIHHPDHNGDEKKAKIINLAYEFLKNNHSTFDISTYIKLRVNEFKKMVIGCDELLPLWVKKIVDTIKYNMDDIDYALLNKNITKEQIDKIVDVGRNNVISNIKKIENTFCKMTGVSIADLTNEGYILVNNISMQYNIRDIYDKLLLAYSKIFKQRITQVLNENNMHKYGNLKKDIEDKIAGLNSEMFLKKLDVLILEFDVYLNNISRQYENDNRLIDELRNDYSDVLYYDSEELNDLYGLCGRSEFNSVYNKLVMKLKEVRKERNSATVVLELNRKLSYVLANVSSLQESIELNKLYAKLLVAINNMELTDDVIGLINSISVDNIEKDFIEILQILNIKVNGIYIPRYRTELSVPIYVACRLYNKEYFLKMMYQNGIAQVVEEVNYDDIKLMPIKEALELSTFVGGTKSGNIGIDNSVICEYNDSKLNRLGIVKNKSTDTIEIYGGKNYISYKSGKQQSVDLIKYEDINTIIMELANGLMPYLKKYLFKSAMENNGRSK